MKVRICKKYYKRSQFGRNPMQFHAEQSGGIGSDVHAVILIDPVLKKHPDLRKPMLQHEIDELKDWGKGKTGNHRRANRKEPLVTRKLGGVCGFWKEIKKREKRAKKR